MGFNGDLTINNRDLSVHYGHFSNHSVAARKKKTIKDRAKNKRSRDGASIGELHRLGHAGLDMVRWGAQRVG